MQLLNNLTESNLIWSQPYCNVMVITHKRHTLKPIGMQVFFQEDPLARWPVGNKLRKDVSAFFTFQNTQQHDMIVSTLLKLLGVHIFFSMGNLVRLIDLGQTNHVSPPSSSHDFRPFMVLLMVGWE